MGGPDVSPRALSSLRFSLQVPAVRVRLTTSCSCRAQTRNVTRGSGRRLRRSQVLHPSNPTRTCKRSGKCWKWINNTVAGLITTLFGSLRSLMINQACFLPNQNFRCGRSSGSRCRRSPGWSSTLGQAALRGAPSLRRRESAERFWRPRDVPKQVIMARGVSTSHLECQVEGLAL